MSRYVIDAGVLALYFAEDERVKNYMDRVLRGIDEGYICEVNLFQSFLIASNILALNRRVDAIHVYAEHSLSVFSDCF